MVEVEEGMGMREWKEDRRKEERMMMKIGLIIDDKRMKYRVQKGRIGEDKEIEIASYGKIFQDTILKMKKKKNNSTGNFEIKSQKI